MVTDASKIARLHNAEFKLWNYVTSKRIQRNFGYELAGKPRIIEKVIAKACRLNGRIQIMIEMLEEENNS